MTAKYAVVLSPDAAADLLELHDYISENDAPAKADHVLDRIEQVVQGLAQFPERGAITKELLALGGRDYRVSYFKPFRVSFRVVGRQGDGYLIADGRRDMRTLLQKRLLRA